MRRLIVIGLLAVAATVLVVVGTGASGDDGGSYKVRAIFDNAFTLVTGEDVRISGVNVGKIAALEVTPDNRAAVVMEITRPGFQDFREDASCLIRPQSLIGERFVECSLTEPRSSGEQAPPALKVIDDGEPGAGQRLLPVTRTSKPVDIDLLNNITRLPERQRLAIILNELGAGVAGRGGDLNETIRRANPALGVTNRVLKLVGQQNAVLRKLASDSDAVLAPLARDRTSVAGFIENANDVSRATAERRADLEAGFERLPKFLTELRPTMTRLQGFADEFEPVLQDLQAAAPDINTLFEQLGPFSQAGIPAVDSLGEAAKVGRPALVATKPIVDDLRGLFGEARPLAANLSDLTASLRDSGGIERFMDFLFFQVAAVNGYDTLGHYLRAGLIVNTCTTYSTTPQPGCSAKFRVQDTAAEQASAANPSTVRQAYAARTAAVQAEQAAGADHSAEAMGASGGRTTAQGGTGARRTGTRAGALKLPTDVLPGSDDGKQAAQLADQARRSAAVADPSASQPTSAQQGVLDYLLGGEG